MYLREVTINGFKSFGLRTKLEFERGVTAIVGPNGCGKSNIAEAIRWVLGEQSAKALRGGSMQDVIFEGNDKRKPHSMSEVSLIFAECESRLGTEFNEVEIVRRVTRDGTGKYYLNGKLCRLRDIQHLFMDTGVGQVSYSFLMQGQIDQIISSNSEGRRFIFEEAAGISKFKSQRKESLNKLALVERDLVRIQDILKEVEKQASALRRQAKKALEYKRIKHSVIHLDLAYLANSGNEYKKGLEKLDDKEVSAKRELDDYKAQFADSEKLLNQSKSHYFEQQQKLDNLELSHRSTLEELVDCKKKIELNEVRSSGIKKNVLHYSSEQSILAKENERINEKLNGLRVEIEKSQKALQLSISKLNEKEKAVKTSSYELEEVETKFREMRADLFRKEQENQKKQKVYQELEIKHEKIQLQIKVLADTQESLNSSLDQNQIAYDQLLQSLTIAKAALEKKETSASEIKKEIREVEETLSKESQNLTSLEKELSKAKAEWGALENLNNKTQNLGGGIHYLVSHADELQEVLQVRELVLKGITFKKGYETAADTVLRNFEDVLAVQTIQDIDCLTSQLLKSNQASYALHVDDWPSNSPLQSLPSFLKPLSECVQLSKMANQEVITKILDGYFVNTSTWSNLYQFISDNSQFSFLKIVNESGEWMESNGIIHFGKEQKAEQSFVGRQSRMEHLSAQIEEMQVRYLMHETCCEDSRKQLHSHQAALQLAQKGIADAQRELMQLELEAKSIEKTIASTSEQKIKNEQRSQLLKKEMSTVVHEIVSSESHAGADNKGLQSLKLEIQQYEELISEKRRKQDQFKDELTSCRLNRMESESQHESLNKELSDSMNLQNSNTVKIQKFKDSISSLNQELNKCAQENDENYKRIKGLDSDSKNQTEAISKQNSRIRELQQLIQKGEQSLIAYRKGESALNEQLQNVKLLQAQERSRFDSLCERVYDEYQTDLSQLDYQRELAAYNNGLTLDSKLKKTCEALLDVSEMIPDRKMDLANIRWDEVKEELAHLKNRLQGMASVNESSLEEFQMAEERYQFLSSQTNDLQKSKKILEEALQQINEKSVQLFEDTFKKIRTNFVYTFDQLTGGGQADLLLENQEDLLNTGVEIIARPPGTKLKSLTLLSGGQKTITAVALLFAIYMVKPSPFCVLDELDAPLDDANIKRFTAMLKEFTAQSQFLIITHSKVTVASADTVYGVTMEEKGVSKVVSMRLQRNS